MLQYRLDRLRRMPRLLERGGRILDGRACGRPPGLTFRFALGRIENETEACHLEALTAAFQEGGLDLRELLVEVALSDSFRNRRVE